MKVFSARAIEVCRKSKKQNELLNSEDAFNIINRDVKLQKKIGTVVLICLSTIFCKCKYDYDTIDNEIVFTFMTQMFCHIMT